MALTASSILLAGLLVGSVGAEDSAPDPDDMRELAEELGFAPLDEMSVPKPTNLATVVKSEKWAKKLGKALFWDQQVGSDGQSCASCHFHAGADNRARNQINPGLIAGDETFDVGDPNYKAKKSDFPFKKLVDPFDDAEDPDNIVRDHDDVFSSAGTFGGDFDGLDDAPDASKRPGVANGGELISYDDNVDPDLSFFSVGDKRTRRVEPRNTPTVINAVFNHRQFWDGRANMIFNGVDPFGKRNKKARVWVCTKKGKLKKRKLYLDNASLASQAVGPPGSFFEMSAAGRGFHHIGKKVVGLRPLALQKVAHDDSLLGDCARSTSTKLRRGLKGTYASLIKKAFKAKYWKSKKKITIDGEECTQMEANFALFFGVSVMLYERCLVSDDTPFDRFMKGDDDALTDQQLIGMELFMKQGECAACHQGAEFTQASINQMLVAEGAGAPKVPIILERMEMGGGGVALYDNGFYNIGVRPSDEDPGVGGKDPFGNPLSFAKQFSNRKLADTVFVEPKFFEVDANVFPVKGERVAIQGAFKVPGLRNVELTGPYMHNGGMKSLEEVVEFYSRGTDFFDTNIDDIDPEVEGIGKIRGKPSRVAAVAAFMRALTDERVRCKSKPFDMPQLFVFNGHKGDHVSTTCDEVDGLADDRVLVLPPTGEDGVEDAEDKLKPFLNVKPATGPFDDEPDDEEEEEEDEVKPLLSVKPATGPVDDEADDDEADDEEEDDEEEDDEEEDDEEEEEEEE